jgi:hypothetical protein
MLFDTRQTVAFTGTPAELEAQLVPLMDALLALADADLGLTDPDLAATNTSRQVDVTMTVDAHDTATAVGRAASALRAAISTSGGTGWQAATAVVHAELAEDPDRGAIGP